MPAAIFEDLNESRRATVEFGVKKAVRQYKIFGTPDGDEAHTLLSSTAPSTHTVLGTPVPRARTRVEPVADTVDDLTGSGDWIGIAEYEFPSNTFNPPAPVDTAVFNFEAQTSSERVFQSLETKARHGAEDDGLDPEGATSYGGLVNVTDDGVEGVEILNPKFSFSITSFVEDTELQSSIGAIAGSVAKVNNASFNGFAAGEVLFVSASGSRRADETSWEVNFAFMVSENLEDIEISTPLAPSGHIDVAEKLGWDYIWTRAVPYTDPDTGRLGTAVEAVYVERMYESADFSLLPIP